MSQNSLLVQCLNPNRILVRATVSNRKRLFESMAHQLCSALDDTVRAKDIYAQLWGREKLGNTGIGNGVALPHARCEYTHQAIIAVITLDNAIDYEASDRQKVDLAFGVLVPSEANSAHLNLLAEIARLVSQNDKKDALVHAQDAQHLIALVKRWTNDCTHASA